jgi:pimeloyl-ACP methyl ester carboxylesterase
MRKTARTLRSARTWLTGRPAPRELNLVMEREDRSVPALLFLPPAGNGPFPAWIALHGVTRRGPRHSTLLRFAQSVAGSGAAVLVPHVPEWMDIHLAPEATLPTIAAGVRLLLSRTDVRPPFGLIGFSFGAPQVLIAGSHESVSENVAGVVSFGGYCDLKRTVHFAFTGEYEWQDRLARMPPEPYGRWVLGANHLVDAPGYGDAGDVAQALWQLSVAAGDRRPAAGTAEHEQLQRTLRSRLARARRGLYDLFVSHQGDHPDRPATDALVEALAAGCRSASPLLEPTPFLGRIEHPVEVLHGRGDRTIPYTESLRLEDHLPRGARARVTVTRLFSHAKGQEFPVLSAPAEVWRFGRALGWVLGTV